MDGLHGPPTRLFILGRSGRIRTPDHWYWSDVPVVLFYSSRYGFRRACPPSWAWFISECVTLSHPLLTSALAKC